MNTVNGNTGNNGNITNTSNTSNIAFRADTIRGLPVRSDRNAAPPPDMADNDERRMRITFRIAFGILFVVPVLVCLLLYAQGAGGNAGLQATAGTCACHGT